MPSPKCNTWARSEGPEGHDLVGLSRNRWSFRRNPIVTSSSWRMVYRRDPDLRPVAVQLPSAGTKLEHSRGECYMWITRGSPGDRQAHRIGERIGSVEGGPQGS